MSDDADEVIEHFTLLPDSVGSARVFSHFGYTLEESLADLVDNSVDAGASLVHIVFHRSESALERVTIADDGRGMSSDRLRAAMQFAQNSSHQATDLGYFGIGMKAASLSQCSSMSVLSIGAEGTLSGCRWTAKSIGGNWQCEALNPRAMLPRFAEAFIGTAVPESGTVVLWENLGKLCTAPSEDAVAMFVANMQSDVSSHLGLVFHVFLRERRLKITLAVRNISEISCFPRMVSPLDPFQYTSSGAPGFPRLYAARLADGSDLALEAHIWPANSLSREYLLGKTNARTSQGFYFYRNERLIQAGGWNGVLQKQEPDLALARVRVSLDGRPATTNVQKSAVELPASLAQSLEKATSSDGSTLTDFLDAARAAASRSNLRTPASPSVKLTLGKGVPYRLRQIARQGVTGEFVTDIQFVWEDLDDEILFEVDRLDSRVILNKRYRADVLGGERGGGADAPLLKTALFLLLERELGRIRSSPKSDIWLQKCNYLLLAALREEA